MAPVSSLDLIDACDAFPDAAIAPEKHAAAMAALYTLVWADSDGEYAIGYMKHNVLAALAAIPAAVLASFGLDATVDLAAIAAASGTVPLYRLLGKQTAEPARTAAVAALAGYWRQERTFQLLRGWRSELWPVYGRDGRLLFSMERSALGLFGSARFGVHLTVYVAAAPSLEDIRIWVPKRAASKSTYPGMLDNTVAGGLMTGEDPFDCLVREADEEASLPAAVMCAQAQPVGTVTYISVTDERAGGEPGYIYPECQWVYDVRLDPGQDVVPQPKDDEVESFALCSVAEVRAQLAAGLYKPNCAVVMLDFLVRHGILTRDNEPHYDAILARLHRPLPFPGPHEINWPARAAAAAALNKDKSV